MDYKLHAKLAVMAAAFVDIAKEFGFTDEQMEDPKASKYIIERIHNLQTAYNIRQTLSDKVDFTKTTPPLSNGIAEK